jgi:hypothetical protein
LIPSFLPRSRIALLALLLWACPVPLAAQCAMCRATAEAGGERTARSLDRAVAMLLVPTVGMMAGIGIVVYRRRD